MIGAAQPPDWYRVQFSQAWTKAEERKRGMSEIVKIAKLIATTIRQIGGEAEHVDHTTVTLPAVIYNKLMREVEIENLTFPDPRQRSMECRVAGVRFVRGADELTIRAAMCKEPYRERAQAVVKRGHFCREMTRIVPVL